MRSFQTGDWTCASCTGRWLLYHWATREALHLILKSNRWVSQFISKLGRIIYFCLTFLFLFPLSSSTTIHKSILLGTPSPWLGTLLTHSYLSGTGIYATAINKYYNSIILAMTQNTSQIPGSLDSSQASWFLSSPVLRDSSLEGLWHPWISFVFGGTGPPCCQSLLIGSLDLLSHLKAWSGVGTPLTMGNLPFTPRAVAT